MIAVMIVDGAIYVEGKRRVDLDGSASASGLYEECRRQGGVAWMDLLEPTREELEEITREFGLPGETAGELLKAHSRPRAEHYGECTFVALLTTRYLDGPEEVEFGEIQLLVGPDFVVSARHGGPSDLDQVRRELERHPTAIAEGPEAILHAVVRRVVEGYSPVVEGLSADIDEIETEVFGGNPRVSQRIYELFREVIHFERATVPLAGVLEVLLQEVPEADESARSRLRELRTRLLRVTEQAAGFRSLLSSILNVNLTLVSVQQADQAKKISAWAAILVVPTVITGVYGMNFRYMPELSWPLGYPLTLLGVAAICLVLYLSFRRSGWL
jgi:magnesium transporter